MRKGFSSFLKRGVIAAGLLALSAGSVPAMAGDASVAVAANFTAPAKRIAALFKLRTHHTVDLSFGSTGKLYAQITQGAPYDIFLAADTKRADKTIPAGFGVAGSNFTYAVGKLALWSTTPGFVDPHGDVLKGGKFSHIAIANPNNAPYGAAGMEVLHKMGLYDTLKPKIVTGENISQTHQFVLSKNAELGFVAYSQVVKEKTGSTWLVPENLYQPIDQGAVMLKRGEKNPVAEQFYEFLKGPEAAVIIKYFGYGLKGK